MALNLGAMIQAARTQQNPAGDAIANYQNQVDRQKAEEQRQFNNVAGLAGLLMGNGGQIGLNNAGMSFGDALKQAQGLIGSGMML